MNLAESLANKFPMSEDSIRTLMKQLFTGVYYLHSHRLIHRDIKLTNLLLKDGVLKIADFGLARFYDLKPRDYTPEVETLSYRAPELLLGVKKYSCSVDIWSIGCVLGELYLKMPLFQGDCNIGQLFKIFEYDNDIDF